MSSIHGFRVVHVIAQLRLGAGRYVVDTAIAQHRREPGRVAVVLSEDAESPWQSSLALVRQLSNAGVTVHRCGDFFHRDSAGLKAAGQMIREALVGPEREWPQGVTVHAHTAMAAVAARWAGAPRVVLTCHGWGPNRSAGVDLQDSLAYSLCDAVTSPSEHWAVVVKERTAVETVAVIPYGLNMERFRKSAPARRPGPPKVVSVGELSRRKGADLLLDAMPRIWTRTPTAELHFVGDGELADELRERARGLDEGGTRIVFHGHLEDPAAILGDFDVFALASRSDNQPIAILEAMATGLPVVATRVGGITELVEGARCGFVVPPENTYELSLALGILVETGPTGCRELGALGARYVRRQASITRHVEALETFYRSGQPGFEQGSQVGDEVAA